MSSIASSRLLFFPAQLQRAVGLAISWLGYMLVTALHVSFL